MKVAILGGGPAGLYAAYLLKRQNPNAQIDLYEQNAADVTFGFGVVLSDRALEFLAADDPETHDAIVRDLEAWKDITIRHQGQSIRIDGVGFTAVGRLRLLQILQQRARSVGVEPRFGVTVKSLDELADADIVVAADGVNSLVRRTHAEEFGATVTYLNNRFAWFGARRTFNTLTQTFRETPLGHFNAHHYRFSPELSTFIVEVDPETFQSAGFERMDEDASRLLCQNVFAEELEGAELICNRSIWRQFPIVHNDRWSVGNRVLVGDALHTAHFSIGSGTRLAFEDVIALAKAVGEHPNSVPDALAAYEAARRPILQKLTHAANTSAEWYEHFPEHMRLAPWEFAMSYISRSGRLDRERLRRMSPHFVQAYEENSLQGTG
ncbi:monooxygenase [Roseomonas sp. KE2513]|uniref:FAD-dependent monooxygenase n=1 Tax=Roseomonas sp. KE2513 TaxID=2479202 RepID=UPI0018DF5E0E|nr:FAD-dependent monooxygenase [Roseomonas sp. KE2513]MBI0538796.1 monooxygenase [Roseomonas sp. KE2513]